MNIQQCSINNIKRYGEIYSKAFSGEPWNDNWKIEDANIHIKELLESKQSYGLECITDGKVVGFILGTTMVFHYGRTFEINDLAVEPEYQNKGIGKQLVEQIIKDVKNQGIVGIHLITSANENLKNFYEKFGFKKESDVILMGLEL